MFYLQQDPKSHPPLLKDFARLQNEISLVQYCQDPEEDSAYAIKFFPNKNTAHFVINHENYDLVKSKLKFLNQKHLAKFASNFVQDFQNVADIFENTKLLDLSEFMLACIREPFSAQLVRSAREIIQIYSNVFPQINSETMKIQLTKLYLVTVEVFRQKDVFLAN